MQKSAFRFPLFKDLNSLIKSVLLKGFQFLVWEGALKVGTRVCLQYRMLYNNTT